MYLQLVFVVRRVTLLGLAVFAVVSLVGIALPNEWVPGTIV